MPPTVKENAIPATGPETSQRAAPATASADTGIKQQPVALEVPVTVNGARTIEGSDKREPFSETTKTVLVFGNGAVIRLLSSVAPGQLLFLTNEKTKKEVVCQVVKSKNYRNVSGYVELEFTESVVGFWGMRFPGDRIGSGPQPAAPAPVVANSSPASGSTAVPRPVVPRMEAPAVNAKEPRTKLAESKFAVPEALPTTIPQAPKVEAHSPQKPVAPVSPLSSSLATSFDPTAVTVERSAPVATQSAIPEVPVIPAPVMSSAPESPLFDAPRISEAQASFLEPAKPSGVLLDTSVPNLLSLFEAKPSAPPMAPPVVPPAVDPETETLKQQTARLQQQLSSMLFSGAPGEPATVSAQIPHVAPVTVQKGLAENAAKVLEVSQISKTEPAPVKPVEPAKLDPPPAKLDPSPVKSSLDVEELKIPSWLEPLARNAAAPTSTQELIDKEKVRREAEQPKLEEVVAETVPAPAMEEIHIPELPMPRFGDSLPVDEERNTRQSGSKSSSKGMVFGAIAAGLLVLVGGGWWFMQQTGGTHSVPAPAQGVQASVISAPGRTEPPQPQGNVVSEPNPAPETKPAVTSTSAPANSTSNSLSNVSAVSPVPATRNSQPSSNPSNRGAAAATPSPAEPVIEQPKKPVLGQVHLAAPKVNANRSSQNSAVPDAGIALTNDEQPGAEALSTGLAGGNNQPAAPAAPLPVGGDVKQAKLISSVPPTYPMLAKNQHVSGNVLVDALIDLNGKVTTMKVVSGPTLLHQAAMDALKQWRYQPATLDGKAVPMHLTVTIQFRLQ
ncbi:MAG TPA: TonB family protein [Candidatus Acidoferrum sp.]|nr:TonB family protein [Candidatus Acidoferrum sp.]